MSQSIVMKDLLSVQSCHGVLRRQPLNDVEQVSRYNESSVERKKQDKISNDRADEESDSGDSLFITQNPVLPAVRSRRQRLKLSDICLSSSDAEGSEDDFLPPTGAPETNREKARKTITLPKYNFHFLSGRKSKGSTNLLGQHNRSLHNFTMGGFFKCAKELWQGSQRGGHLISLPTVDMEGEHIDPLSEEEEERSGDEDIRVVERKHFVVKLKTKHRQPWCSQINQQQQQQSREKAGNAGQGTSPEVQHGTSHKTLAKASTPRVTPLSLDTEMFDDGESLCGFQAKRARSDESVTRDSNFLDRCKAPKRATRNRKTRGSERKDSTTAAEPQTGDTHTDGQPPIGQTDVEPDSRNILHRLPQLKSDTDNNSVCQESRANKRKTEENSHGSVENEMRQGQEEPEGLCVAKSVNVEVDETPSLSDSRAEPPAWQTGDELEFNERNCMESSSHGDATVTQAETDSPKSKHKKKKRKKCAAQNVSQEEDRKLESEVRMEESSVSKKKKKRKKRREEEAAQLQLSPAHVPLSDGAGAEFKEDETTAAAGESGEGDAWNTSTGQMEKSGNGLENTASSEVTLKSSKVKKKKHKKKQESSCVDANDTKGGEKVVDVTLCNDDASSEESTRKSVKKMKTKKLSDGADTSYPSEKNEQVEYSPAKPKQGLEDQNAAIVTKKKKKGKLFRRIPSEDGVAQSDESVSVQKKTKKRTSSFLAADVEEKDAQTEGEQNSLPQFTDAHVWGSENPSVSAGDFEMKSAEMAGTLEDSNNRVWKKNKKRKRKTSLMEDGVEEDHKQDFEEPKSTLPDSTNAGAKRKNEDAELKESTENTCSVVSHGRKGKNLTSPLVSKGNHTHSDDISGASHTFGRACKETVFEQASPSKALKVRSPKLSNTSVSNLSFSDYIMEKKKKKFKHKLHSFNLAFLSDV